MPTVYSYTRFSDPKQAAGGSADRQAQYAAKWAAEHGMELDATLTLKDEGLSAYHQRHVKAGSLGVFLRAVEDGRVEPGSVLIVEGLDRLSRAEPIVAQGQLAQIINSGITVVTAMNGQVYSREEVRREPMKLLMSLIEMIRAHEESDTKSKRVNASIRRLCQKWTDGTYRGLITNGRPPFWVKWNGSGWDLLPDRVEALRAALAMFRTGYGATLIIRELSKRDLHLIEDGGSALSIYRVIRNRALVGEKEVTVEGDAFILRGYYPEVLSMGEWDELQRLADDRGKRRVKGEVPHLITGLNIAKCGYCGHAIVGQNLAGKKRLPDGRIRDSYRRLLCGGKQYGTPCPVGGSTSVVPVERAIFRFCSDLMNLQDLLGGNAAATGKAALASKRRDLADRQKQLDRVTAALMTSDEAPTAFVRKARELEDEISSLQKVVNQAERELASTTAREATPQEAARWSELLEACERQEFDARMSARSLVRDTFARIDVFHAGINRGGRVVDLLLKSRSGVNRWLRVNKAGEVMATWTEERANPVMFGVAEEPWWLRSDALEPDK